MGAATRDLLSFAVSRARTETVTLVTVYATPSPALDGTYTFYTEDSQALARVVGLTSNETERLAAGGISLNQGFSVAIVGEVQKSPDRVIRADGTVLKVMRNTVEEGASVFICDMPPLGEDGTSYGSGYSNE